MMNKIVCVLFLGLALFSCTKEKIEKEEVQVDNKVSYREDVQKIFDNHCIVCHNEAASVFSLKAAESYKNLTKGEFLNVDVPAESPLLIKLNEGHPDGMELLDKDIKIIETWIKEGALDN